MISLFFLIMRFKVHRQALLKVINESDTMPNTSLDKFENLVNQIQESNSITFTDEEIILVSTKHIKALQISFK